MASLATAANSVTQHQRNDVMASISGENGVNDSSQQQTSESRSGEGVS